MKSVFKFKQVLVIILTLATLFSFASCGIYSDDDIKLPLPLDGTERPEKSEKNDDTEETTTKNDIATIEEQVCFEWNGVKVTAKKIEENLVGTYLKLLVENDSNNDYSIGIDKIMINDFMVSEWFSCTVAAGKKANDNVYLLSTDLSAAGIDKIGKIEIYFYVYDSSTYKRFYESECVTIKTSLYDKMDTTVKDKGTLLCNENGVKIFVKYVKDYNFLAQTVVLYIENNRDENISISCDDMSINGFMVTAYLYENVYSGKKAIGTISILKTELEDNDIDDVEEIELKFRVLNSDNYKKIFETDAVSFNVR